MGRPKVKGSFPCNVCGRSMPSKIYLLRHMRNIHLYDTVSWKKDSEKYVPEKIKHYFYRRVECSLCHMKLKTIHDKQWHMENFHKLKKRLSGVNEDSKKTQSRKRKQTVPQDPLQDDDGKAPFKKRTKYSHMSYTQAGGSHDRKRKLISV